MAYRNKTFVSFASPNLLSYRLMRAWRANPRFDFDFHDAHDLNVALDTSRPATIRRRLRERLANTKQVVLLVGPNTRTIAARPSRFLYYEVDVINGLGLPVVFANLNGSRKVRRTRLPQKLQDNYTLSVSFQPIVIKHALDHWVPKYRQARLRAAGPVSYNQQVYTKLGL